MKSSRVPAIFVPDGLDEETAFRRITHLGIGAHQDDLEFMAFHGIKECFDDPSRWFGGVVCTNGAGSARAGRFAQYSDAQMTEVRMAEQNEAARLGSYGVMVQLGYSSAEIKQPQNEDFVAALAEIIQRCEPEVIYTHNPADKHDAHIAVLNATLAALRRMPPMQRPQAIYGCEVWRDLDWLADEAKVVLDVSGHEALAEKLNSVFASQIAGGKRYDLAVMGRRRANATFFDPRRIDGRDSVIYALDLTPLIQDDSIDLADYIGNFIEDFRRDVMDKIKKYQVA